VAGGDIDQRLPLRFSTGAERPKTEAACGHDGNSDFREVYARHLESMKNLIFSIFYKDFINFQVTDLTW